MLSGALPLSLSTLTWPWAVGWLRLLHASFIPPRTTSSICPHPPVHSTHPRKPGTQAAVYPQRHRLWVLKVSGENLERLQYFYLPKVQKLINVDTTQNMIQCSWNLFKSAVFLCLQENSKLHQQQNPKTKKHCCSNQTAGQWMEKCEFQNESTVQKCLKSQTTKYRLLCSDFVTCVQTCQPPDFISKNKEWLCCPTMKRFRFKDCVSCIMVTVEE